MSFFKCKKPKIVRCDRHGLLEALDVATATEKAEENKLRALREERKRLVGELIAFAEPKYFKRYRIKESEDYKQLIERDIADSELVQHWIRCASNINPYELYKRPNDVFEGFKPLVEYLDREDFEDYPETYELVRLLLTVIHSCDAAITKQEKVWQEAGNSRRKVVNKIEAAAVAESENREDADGKGTR